MFEKNLKRAYLLDFYSDVLDEHTRSVMMAYYEDDLSLAEIADGIGISRQGVRHIIKKGDDELEFLESRLKLSQLYEDIDSARDLLSSLQKDIVNEEINEKIEKVISLLSNKGN